MSEENEEVTGPYVLDKVKPWVNDAIVQHAHGEPVSWLDATLMTPNGPMMGIIVYLASPVLGGSSFQGLVQVPDPIRLTEEDTNRTISEMIQQLLSARSRSLAPSNGGGGQPGDLVVPGDAH